MVRRTSCCSEGLHLLYEEGKECSLILDRCFCHGVEVCLIGRTATLGYHHETILSTFHSLDVYLCRQVTTSVDLIIHVERCILRVAQVILCVGIVNTQ